MIGHGMRDKPQTVKLVKTDGGYAVFVSPRAQPVAVFSSGYELLDWVAAHIAQWEAGRADAEPQEAVDEAREDDGPPDPPAAGSA